VEKENNVVLAVEDLKTYFNTDDGIVKAVDGISFTLHKGETLGIVGESGCGKSVSCLSIMNLIPSPPGKIVSGEVNFLGKNILDLDKTEIREIRGRRISMIFQDPMTSLNPFLRISTQMTETISLHQSTGKTASREKAIEMLRLVGIPNPGKRIDHYPHQFSGGMRQRVMIAMALSCNPEILIADEPTTALDVTIQAQILDIMKELSVKTNTSVILITHDLGVVAGMCESVCVMYAGKIIEKAPARDLFNDPKHPYTMGLIQSVPRIDKPQKDRLFSIQGQPPDLIDLPDACPFHPRCSYVMDICREKFPGEIYLPGPRSVCCYLYSGETKK
jgi:oligopeptide/dipeptide ABC transporter ATP-binding protein